MPDGNARDSGTVALAIMAKAPRVGASKTRLSPPLTASEAADLSACFIADLAATIDALPQALAARGVLCFTPADESTTFDDLLPPGFPRLAQRGETLSERCAAAIDDLLAAGHAGACLLNADSPTLPPAYLHAAVDAVRADSRQIVVGPALDGGYYLIGASQPCAEVFRDIPWSTPQVYDTTLRRAAELARPVVRLPTWYDVDNGLALAALVRELFEDGVPPVDHAPAAATEPAYTRDAPRTRALLKALLDRGRAAAPPLPVQMDTSERSSAESWRGPMPV